MGSDSKPFEPAAPAMPAGTIGITELRCDAAEMLASIGYEAADPSLQSPHWHETLQGLPNRRDRR